MAGIICKQCGYENPEGSTICEICAEELAVVDNIQIKTENEDVEYYVMCPESQTKTILVSNKVNSFFCEGCKREHEIDGFLWNVEERNLRQNSVQTIEPNLTNEKIPSGEKLILEEVNSHFTIEIDKNGGTLGRYGRYGAEFFQSHNLLMVSGEHCMITNEYGNWVIRHMSRTNETKYNNMILGSNEPNLLEDGKILTLANAISFIVRME